VSLESIFTMGFRRPAVKHGCSEAKPLQMLTTKCVGRRFDSAHLHNEGVYWFRQRTEAKADSPASGAVNQAKQLTANDSQFLKVA